MSMSLVLVPALGLFPFYLFALSYSDVSVFGLYFICYVSLLSLRRLFFSNERQRVDLDGRGSGLELGGAEGGEAIFRTYCMRKESIFHKRWKGFFLFLMGLVVQIVLTLYKLQIHQKNEKK